MARSVVLINDSFPPLIDGVVNTVVNYAGDLLNEGYQVSVITPEYPNVEDNYPYPVIRTPSIDTTKLLGYRSGTPLFPSELQKFSYQSVDIIHSHCPMASTFVAKELRDVVHAPLVLTYHTKFDIDIAKAIRGKLLQEGAIKALVMNINTYDEVWTVSKGAGENLRSIGYEGDYIVMPNGVDVPKGRADEAAIEKATQGIDLPAGIPVFLFVGRMMWYKGVRITLDALKILQNNQIDFRMIFIGDGTDRKEMEEYTEKLGLHNHCYFLGAIHDRDIIRGWYSRADLFLFPSTFDTNGLVVREAAACGLGSILVRGSCAAEDVTENQNGFLMEENAESMASVLQELCAHPEKMKDVGAHAMDELYLSWHGAIKNARDRYEIVIDNYLSGKYPQKADLIDEFFRQQAGLIEIFKNYDILRLENRMRLKNEIEYVGSAIKDAREVSEQQVKQAFYKFRHEAKNLKDDVRDFFDLYI